MISNLAPFVLPTTPRLFTLAAGGTESASLHALHQELRACQRRLGTPEEQVEDLNRARELAHQINNQLTVAQLRAEIGANQFSTFCLIPTRSQRLVA